MWTFIWTGDGLTTVRCGHGERMKDLEPLRKMIENGEEEIIRRLMVYAIDRDYSKYTSTLEEAWRVSIAGLSNAITGAIAEYSDIPELSPDEDYRKDPIAAFGILEAQRHRQRGIPLDMFPGLLKYYRQTYIDIILDAGFESESTAHFRLFVERCFDRIEIGSYKMEFYQKEVE